MEYKTIDEIRHEATVIPSAPQKAIAASPPAITAAPLPWTFWPHACGGLRPSSDSATSGQ